LLLVATALGPSTPTGLAQQSGTELTWSFEGLRHFSTPAGGCAPTVSLDGLAFGADTIAAGWSSSGCGEPYLGLVAATREADGEWLLLKQDPVPSMHGRPALTLSPQGQPFYVYAGAGPNDTYFIYEQDMAGGAPIRRMGIAASQSSQSHPNISATFDANATSPTFAWAARTGFGGPLALGSPLGDVTIATLATYSVDNDGSHVAVYANHSAGLGVYYSPGAAGDLRPVITTTQSAGVSIAREPTGRIHIASSGAGGSNNNYDTRLVLLSSDDGHTWERTDLDLGSTRNPSIAVDSFGNPAIAYARNETEIRLARRVNGTWQHTLLALLPFGDGNVTPHLAFDAADRPHVLYYDTGTRTIMLARGEAAVVARTLTVSTVGAGTGEVTSAPAGISCGTACQASFAPGQNVLLEAHAEPGSAFSGWGGACTGTGPCLVSMTAATSVVAAFVTTRPPIEVAPPGSGGCTLAGAILSANADAAIGGCAAGSGADVIHVPAGTHLLTTVADTQGGMQTGLPLIASDITIIGDAAESTIIERAAGAPAFRIMRVHFIAGSRLTLDGVTLRGGDGGAQGGGAIYTNNPTVIRNSVLADNYSSYVGGAIHASAALTVSGSLFTNNQAPFSDGGAIYATGSQTSPLTITTSKFENNSALWGGAVDFSTAAPHASAGLIANTIFNGNTARYGGGAVIASALTFMRVTVTGNLVTTAGVGGGLYVSGTTIRDSTITDNVVAGSTGAGGGVLGAGGTLTIENTTIARNLAHLGGGASMSGTVSLTNVTISGNRAATYGGGILQGGGRADLQNVTVVENEAGAGGGVASAGFAVVSLQNTIIALNRGGPDYPDCYSNGYPLESTGHNLIGKRASCPYTPNASDLIGTLSLPIDPLLGALQDNGGSTVTHLPALGSPAVDAGSPLEAGSGATACALVDQRGIGRPQRAACDIGAVERANAAPVIAAQSIFLAEDMTGVITLTATDADSDPITFAIVEPPAHGTLAGSAPEMLYTPFADFNGEDSFTFAAVDSFGVSGAPATVSILVIPVNDPPSAVDDVLSLEGNGGAQIVNVLANDSDAPDTGETLTILSATAAAHGLVTVAPDRTHVLYAPSRHFAGSDTFTYVLSDGHGPTATANVTVLVTPTVDLSVAVSATPNPSTTGTVTSWRTIVTNDGAMDSIGGTTTISFVGQVGFLALPAGCSRSGNLVTCALPMLPSGHSHTFDIAAVPEAVGAVTLTAHAHAAAADPDTENDDAFVIVPVTGAADLRVDLNGPASLQTGHAATYFVTVTNGSGVTAENVMVVVNLPLGAESIEAPSCLVANVTVHCEPGSLPSNNTAVKSITFVPTRAGAANLVATVSSTTAESDLGNNTVAHPTVTTLGNADLEISISESHDPAPQYHQNTVEPDLTYTLHVKNNGPAVANAVTVTVVLPPQADFNRGSLPVLLTSSKGSCTLNVSPGGVTCAIGSLTDGETAVVSVAAIPRTVGTLELRAAVTSDSPDPSGLDNSKAETTAVTPVVDLSVSMSDNLGPEVLNRPLAVDSYNQLVVTVNQGDFHRFVGEATVTITAPAGWRMFTDSFRCTSEPAATVSCTITPEEFGQLSVASFNLYVRPGTTGPFAITASVAPGVSAFDPDRLNNTFQVEAVAVPAYSNLRIFHSVDPTGANSAPGVPLYAGETFEYDISVRNDGPSSARDIVITDTLPIGLEFISAAGFSGLTSPNCGATGRTVVCTSALLDGFDDDLRWLVIGVRVRALAAGTYSNHVVVTAGSDLWGDPGGRSSTIVHEVLPGKADLRVAIIPYDIPLVPVAGDSLEYMVNVRNHGPQTAHHLKVLVSVEGPHALPALQRGFVGVVGGSCTTTSVTTAQCVASSSVASGELAMVRLSVEPTGGGTITVNASATADEEDPVPADNIAATVTTGINNTPAGINVSVAPIAAGKVDTPVTVTFANVTQSGTTSLSIASWTGGLALPHGFSVGDPAVVYDISTTAAFSGEAIVCINYGGVAYPPGDPLRLLHFESGAWIDRTASIDADARIICARTTSFSPFVVVTLSDDTPRMRGEGHVIAGNAKVEFEFSVLELVRGREFGQVEIRIRQGRRGKFDDDRFESRSVTDVVFSNAPEYGPGRNPKTGVDTVAFKGTGKWDGRAGYTYVVTASDRGEPGRDRDTFTIEVRSGNGQVVFSGGGALTDGNVQSTRLHRPWSWWHDRRR
jgi:uncharacterized repeat protein (TIGR01451 family)